MKRIVNGTVIDPSNSLEGEYDVLLEGSKIKAVEPRGSFARTEVEEEIDATDRWVMPGFIDLHVHLREPGFEWKETIATGARAAVLGGYTSICSMPNTNPVNDSAQVTEFIREQAAVTGLARVLPIGAVSIGLKGKEMSPLSELRHAGCVAFSDDGEPIWDSGMMRRALEWCRMLDAVISCHEEDKCLSCSGSMNESGLSEQMGLVGMPTVAEDVMVARDIELARYTGGKVHICHISSARGVELVRRAKSDGFQVSCEVTPHHLVLTESAVEGFNTDAKMSPPLRGEEDVQALIEGLADGTIDAIASDHAPHELDSKQKEFAEAAMGILGLQTSLPLVLELVEAGKISRRRAIEAMSAKPAEVFGLEGGSLATGAVADVVIVDPKRKWVFDSEVNASLSNNSPFLGRQLCGAADTVLVGGSVVVSKGEVLS